jgi:uncharacterized protein
MRRVFAKDSFFSLPAEALFEFHERPDAFKLLTPSDFAAEVHSTASTLRPSGEIVSFTKREMGLPFQFEMIHTVYEKPWLFVDEQLRGPFSTWKHEHSFLQGGWDRDPATLMRDKVTYAHPLLFAGNFAVAWPLAKLFEERHAITQRELAEAMRAPSKTRRRKIVITGATGLIGGRIAELLIEKGERVVLLVRNIEKARHRFGDQASYAEWDFHHPERGDWRAALAEAEGVIHLAGTPLFAKRWTPEFKRDMKESRTLSTRQLVEAIKASDHKPESFVCASAIGVYGPDPTLLADETSPAGDDLLADICEAWEEEARAVEEAGVRSVQMRIGVVVDRRSGALKEMMPLFWLGGGGILGAPDRWLNWIHLEDAARIFLMALYNDELSGPYNVAAPRPVTNRTFAYTLAHVLRRPCLMRYPELLIRIAIGEAATYAAGGPRVTADLIRSKGYTFFFDDLEEALRSLLGRPK